MRFTAALVLFIDIAQNMRQRIWRRQSADCTKCHAQRLANQNFVKVSPTWEFFKLLIHQRWTTNFYPWTKTHPTQLSCMFPEPCLEYPWEWLQCMC